MKLFGDYKVPGGKLLRIEAEVDGAIIVKLRIDGDFFAYPETDFEEAEKSMSGTAIAAVTENARAAFARPGLTLAGLSVDDIVRALAEICARARP